MQENEESSSQIMPDDQAFGLVEESKEGRGKKRKKFRSTTDSPDGIPNTAMTKEPLRAEDIRLEDEEDEEDEYENESSEEEDEGGEKEHSPVQSPEVQVRGRRRSVGPSYNPKYSVFNTEAKFLGDVGGNRQETFNNDPFRVDDFYIDNIRANDTEIKLQRTRRIVPPKAINLTEQDEQRMKEFELNLRRANSPETGRHLNRMEALEAEIQKLDTKRMTKQQLQELREKERILYYRENIMNNMQLLEIKAIEFDWIFGKEGAKFINTIAHSDSIELFSLEIVQIIVLFFWQYYKKRIIFASLIPFLIYFATVIAYVTFIHPEDLEKGDDNNDWRITAYVLIAIILTLSAYHIGLEILYLCEKRLKYFTTFWTYVNLFSIGLSVACVIIDLRDQDESQYFIPVGASAVVVMWLKLFYFGRIINSTSTIVRMIIEISKDMVPFLFIMFVVMGGFSNSFFIIALNKEEEGPRFTRDNFILSLLYTWRNGLGDFITDEYPENNYPVLVFIIWLLCTFFVLIVFLNLLIAVLTDSFDKIQETLENNLLKEMATMMAENEVC